MKTINKIHKIWGKVTDKTTVDVSLVLEELKVSIGIRPIRAFLLWYAAWSLKKKSANSLVLSYFKYTFALVLMQPSLWELVVRFLLPENHPLQNALLTIVQWYDDTHINYIVLGLITFVLLTALYFNYLSNKAKANSELIYRQIFASIKPIVHFDDFLGFYQKHEVRRFVNSPIYERIKNLIADHSTGHVRLLALSGTGKTFLIQSAFMEMGDTSKVFYCDEVRHQDMLSAALNLSNEFDDATLILDNCPSEVCENIIKRIGNKVRIVSAYYDPTDNAQGSSTLTFNDCNMDDIVTRIIDENVNDNITNEQKQKLIRHSGKIPFMALLLAKAYNSSQGISENIDRALLDHLLDIQGQNPHEQRIAMRTLSLLQPFEFNNAQSNIAKFLIGSDEFTPIEINIKRDLLFKNVVRSLSSRSLIDQDSVFINVRPQPLAIWLVGEWIKDRGIGIIDAMAELAEQDDLVKKPILESWSRRLEFMQGNEQAEALYSELLNLNGGPFANENVVCSDFGSRLILAMSTVNPVAVSNSLYDVLFIKPIKWLYDNLQGDARRNIVNSLEKLCFCGDSFHKSAMLLARLALAENEDWANNSKGQFKQLFHVYLAGTEANLDSRVGVIKSLYNQDKNYYPLLCDAIKGAFSIERLSRMGGAERFGFKELTDYVPTSSEIRKYWDSLFDILSGWVEDNPQCVYDIAEIVQLNTRRFVRGGYPKLLYNFLELIAPKLDYRWNNMHKALQETLNFDRPSQQVREQLSHWIERLTPLEITAQMKAAVHEMYINERGLSDIVSREEDIVIPYAKDFVCKKRFLSEEMDDLVLNGKDYISWAYSTHIALNLTHDDIVQMGDYIKKVIQNHDKTIFSSFIVSLYSKIPDKSCTKTFIMDLYEDKYFMLALSLFAVTDDPEKKNLVFALNQANDAVITDKELRQYFSAIRLSSAEEILQVLTIIKRNSKDASLAFDFISSYWYLDELYQNENLLEKYKSIILDYPILDNKNYNYEYTRLAERLLDKTKDEGFAIELNRKLINVLSYNSTHNGLEDLYGILLTKYREAIWSEFIEALTDVEHRVGFLIHLRYKIGSGFDFGDKSLFSGHEEEMKQVCNIYPKYGPWVCAALCPVFDQTDEETGLIESFHPFAIWLIKNYGEDKKILHEFQANLGTFHWTGSVVPLLEDRRRCFENLRLIPDLPTSVREWVDLCLIDNKKEYERESQNDAYMRMAYGIQQ